MSRQNHLWLALALLVAFALRAYMLDAQSLWNDEGTSVALASLSVEAIIAGAARDIHPPLYYLLLHFWMPFVGTTEYAIRFLSVVGGVLAVAVVFRIAYSVFDKHAAVVATFLVALSSFQVYYSQETRMYIWVTLFAALSVFAMVLQFKIRNSKFDIRSSDYGFRIMNYELRIWFLYITATLAALYTHYFAAMLLVAENLAFALWWLVAIRNTQYATRHLVHWLITQTLIAAAFAPWFMFAGNQLATWPSISEPFDLPTLLWQVLNVFSVGLTLEGAEASVIAVAFGILFLIGWLPMRDADARRLETRRLETAPTHSQVALRRLENSPRRRAWQWVGATSSRQLLGITTLILWTLVPVAAMYIVSLSRPAYNPKFLLLATPAFYILTARGLGNITFYVLRFTHHAIRITHYVSRNLSFVICSFVILAFNLPSLINYYHDPRYARDDYRSVVRYIDANARAGDGVLIDAPGQIDVVRYYHRGDQQLFLLPRMRPPDPAATRADVDEMLAKVQRLFAIYYATEQSDPQNIIGTRLAERAFTARDEWRGDIRLAIYGIAPTPRGNAQTLDAKLGNEITLTSYVLDTRAARADDVLTLTLNWRAERTPSARYKVFVHLLDASNRVVAQRDAEPVSNLRLTTTWRASEPIADNYGIFIEPNTPQGDYRIEIGMYRVSDGTRLPIVARDGKPVGDHLILEMVRVSE